MPISSRTGYGLDRLRTYFRPGATIALLGSSGAGKSTLINAITGEEIMETSEIRESDSKGRHTTTHRQMIMTAGGVCIIDTPGMREVGMANVQEGIDDTFFDIVELERCCKFSDCKHDTEPGCAIKAAIESGELSLDRYMPYLSLGQENHKNYAKKKEISKWRNAVKKVKKNNHIIY